MTLSADPHDEYARRLETRRAALANREQRHLHVGYARLLVALVAVVMTYLAFGRGAFSGWFLLAPAALLWWLGGQLQRVETERTTLARAAAFYERALARLDGRWAGTGETGERFLDETHLYAHDLDIFGRASVFELLSAARTRMGEDTLAEWLRHPATPEIVRARQEAVVELAPRVDLREALAVLGEHARVGVHPEALAAWGERAPVLAPSPFRVIAWVISVMAALAMAAFIASAAPAETFPLPDGVMAGLRVSFVVMMVIVLAILFRFRPRTERILREAADATHDLDLLAGVLETLEAERVTAQRLVTLRAALETDGQRPSRRMTRLHRLMDMVDSRNNMFVGLIGSFLLWDLHLAYALEAWRRTSGPAMRRWLSAVGEIEALSSLAAYRYEHPQDVFPELVEQSPRFDGEAVGHPLLDARAVVPNDVSLGDLQVLIVSGSNMSGKSTLLRTVGVNAVLAQAGAPVRARRLRLSPLALGASIRIHDSLQDGTSRFYAEITRLRQIMDTAAAAPVLFLLDELLHGTNSHDRRIGAEAIVRSLAERGAIGLVTTHDLALAHIAETLDARGANVHFEDHLDNGQMRFDYRMRPGIVEKSNALELMRSVGLQV